MPRFAPRPSVASSTGWDDEVFHGLDAEARAADLPPPTAADPSHEGRCYEAFVAGVSLDLAPDTDDDDGDGGDNFDVDAAQSHKPKSRTLRPSGSCFTSPTSTWIGPDNALLVANEDAADVQLPLAPTPVNRRQLATLPPAAVACHGRVIFNTVGPDDDDDDPHTAFKGPCDVAIKSIAVPAACSEARDVKGEHDAAQAEMHFAERVVLVLGEATPKGAPCANPRTRTVATPPTHAGDAAPPPSDAGRSCWRHLAQLHSAEIDEGERRCTVVYEALHGGTLADAVAARGGGGGGGGRGLPAAGLRTVARDVLRGLQALHGTFRAVHNDLKLDNAMLTTPAAAACVAHGCSCPGDSDECPHAPHVKLIDFGCAALMPLLSVEAVASGSGSARVDDDEAYAFSQRGALGTMAPERLRGDGYGPKADVWALGAMLLHAARGRHAFLSPPAAVVARSPAAGAPGTARFWRLAAVLQFTAGMPEREAATRDAVTAALNDRAPFSRDAVEEEQFRSFVRFALQADPARRASVAELLAHPWLASRTPHPL